MKSHWKIGNVPKKHNIEPSYLTIFIGCNLNIRCLNFVEPTSCRGLREKAL